MTFSKRPKYGNKKVVEADGTKSDSKLESFLKHKLDQYGISYEQQVKHVLMEGFKYNGSAVREISYRLDFLVDSKYAVETKGFFTPDGKIKWKLFLSMYRNRYSRCIVLKNQKQCLEFVYGLVAK